MKKISYSVIACIGALFWIKAQTPPPPPSTGGANGPKTPCDTASWRGEKKDFPTGNIAIPANRLPAGFPATNVSFDAVLDWQQKDYKKPDGSTFICSLKDPKITIAGYKSVVINVPGDASSPYTLVIHPEGFLTGDKFGIDATMITGADYGTLMGEIFGSPSAVPPVPPTRPGEWVFGTGGTSKTTNGGRDVTWTWLSYLPQPSSVAITGDEGKKIEIDHNSPNVVIVRIVDKNGVVVSPGTSFPHPWQMKHTVTAN